jgi:hypothetical protein
LLIEPGPATAPDSFIMKRLYKNTQSERGVFTEKKK